MAIAQQNTASLTISLNNSQNIHQIWQPARLGAVFIRRLWWHTKSYGIVFSIMFLTLMSLIFLSIYWSYRHLLIFTTPQDELDMESSK
ncbi:hypothetical protein NIES2109_08280 [Nostoc sp. HK-01]|uniref:Uncharacterized protein n=1 Tax=Anabaenopsis circularis NIES-21 TaxID=1085406 RepID=A0A1Z4GL66_9CYAN|nr:hypothetical protein NIES21_40970 [Anabaenopsis circularis NIES-21]BBD58059.1 hypothetical protein NIES2109_08280 [Nostoc sp. HK-01]